MNKKEAYEVISQLISEQNQEFDFMQEWPNIDTSGISTEVLNLFEEAVIVEHYGGEDQGSTYYTVYHFPSIDLYIQFDGWYQSYEGAEFVEMFPVEPKQVQITQFSKINL